MVVGKVMMRWSAWERTPEPKRRYLVRLRVKRLEGFLPGIAGDSKAILALEVRWKGTVRGRGIPYLHRRPRGSRSRSGGVSGVACMKIGGDAEWMVGEENEFEKVCCFSPLNVGAAVGNGGGPVPFGPREISFSVLLGNEGEGKAGKKRKLKVVGSTAVNLGKWAWDFHLKTQGGEVEAKETSFHTERKQVPITLRKDDLITEATIHVDVSFIDIESHVHGEEIVKSRKHEDVLDDRDFLVTGDPCSSSDMDSDLPKWVPIARKDLPPKHRRNSSSINSSSSDRGDSSPEIHLHSSSNHRFLLWGSKSRTKKVTKEKANKEHSEATEEEDDPIGKWESREFISRDKQTKMKTPSFFASIDQRDETADGESACTALVAVIANALHSRAASMPSRSEFDTLIREGSSEWRRLCNDESYTERFPNKHFDLDTILEAEISSMLVLPEKSFIGFFEPESFESLRGAVSFDDIWSAITKDNFEGVPKVYIVSWNDHFFLLILKSEAYFIIDTLGERLFEGCRKAYMLKFDETTEMRIFPVGEDEDAGEVIWNGKDCCREFIKRFFAAIPLREELELEGKGQGSSALHQRLQIELHYTVGCGNVRSPKARSQKNW